MVSLRDTTAVVGGGTGSVGEGIVRAFLGAGARVIVPYRSDGKRRRLEEYVQDIADDRLSCRKADVSDPEAMEAFSQSLRREYERIDLAVACFGGWYYGYSLHRMPFSDWRTVIQGNLDTHFLFIRAVLSIMHERNHGTYVMINGGQSEVVPPESGAVSIVAAAQRMMTRVIDEEARGNALRTHSIVAFNPLRTRFRGTEVVESWLTAEELGTYIAGLHTRAIRNADATIHTLYNRADLDAAFPGRTPVR